MAGKDLYEVLGLTKAASQAEIKKAYHRLALQLHPDKNVGNEEAKEKFQTLQHIYAVLGDPERRKLYDETGATDDDSGLAGKSFTELYNYYRGLYKEVTEDEVDNFSAEYRGSEEEQRDLLAYYQRFKGDMAQVFEWLMCSDAALDSHRFRDAIDAAIEAGEAKKHKAYSSWAAKVATKRAPKDPLGQAKKKQQKPLNDTQALVAAIRGRSEGHPDMFAALEAKYCKPTSKRKGSKEEPASKKFSGKKRKS
ncbi:hypothetical protein WJX73_010286 [Symbiochloris irregularis]|uniref:J domain-containing protein n=1 Tax=Symbiochloris irregularis TaxID=706552 RepID=A0AAW1NV87_9CHLO